MRITFTCTGTGRIKCVAVTDAQGRTKCHRVNSKRRVTVRLRSGCTVEAH